MSDTPNGLEDRLLGIVDRLWGQTQSAVTKDTRFKDINRLYNEAYQLKSSLDGENTLFVRESLANLLKDECGSPIYLSDEEFARLIANGEATMAEVGENLRHYAQVEHGRNAKNHAPFLDPTDDIQQYMRRKMQSLQPDDE